MLGLRTKTMQPLPNPPLLDPPLSGPALAAYAAPALPLAALAVPLYIYLPTLYAETLGLGLTLVGAILLAARIFDALTDPLVGVLADRFPRRKPWLLGALPLVCVSVWALFFPPAGAGAGHLLGWSLALYLGWTALQVPYLAWGTDLSHAYHGRTRIAGAREAALLIGTLAATLTPALLGLTGLAAVNALGLMIVVLLVPAIGLACWRLPEKAPVLTPKPSRKEAFRLLVTNKPFRLLLVAYLLNGIANGLPATLFLSFVADRLGAPEATGPALALYFVSGLAGVPLWLWLSRRWGKHRVWRAGLLLSCAAFLPAPFLSLGDAPLFFALAVATGLMMGADLVLPPAMQADVIEADRLAGGGERAGLYFALWGMATKASLALAVGLAFPLLDLAGFVPGTTQSSGGWALAALYGGAPLAFKLLAWGLLRGYALDEAALTRLRHSSGEASWPADGTSPPPSSSSLAPSPYSQDAAR